MINRSLSVGGVFCCARPFGVVIVAVLAVGSAASPESSGPDPITFETPQEFAATGAATAEAADDVDQSGFFDLAVVIPGCGCVEVFLNLAVGGELIWPGFGNGVTTNVSTTPSAAALGQLVDDVDGFPDVVVTDISQGPQDDVLIFEGNGDGTFTTPAHAVVGVGQDPSDVVIGLFNGCDGLVDIAVSDQGSNDVFIIYGDAGNTYTTTNPCPGAEAPEQVAPISLGALSPSALTSDDFDNNKCPDLVGSANDTAAEGPTNGKAFVLCADENDGFVVTSFEAGVNPKDVVSANLNPWCDDLPEVIVVNEGDGILDGTVKILVNTSTPLNCNFDASLPLIPVGPLARSVTVADLDGDTDADLAVVASHPNLGFAVFVLRNIGGPLVGIQFDIPVAVGVDADANAVLAVELDGAGFFDLVTANTDDGPSGGSVTGLINNSPQAPPVPLACPYDCDDSGADGFVGIGDLFQLFGDWGMTGPCDHDPDDTGSGIADLFGMFGA